MEAQTETICPHCNEAIQQNQPKAEAPCHQFFHTACYVYLRSRRNGHLDNCEQCFELFYPNEDVTEDDNASDDTMTPRLRIRNHYDSNEKFRTLVHNLAKQKTLVSKSITKVTHFSKEKKNEVRNQLLTMKNQLQGLIEGKQTELRESQEYNDYIKVKRRYDGLVNQLQRNYDCSQYAISTFLNDKKGLRRFQGLSRWSCLTHRFMVKPWRYRVPV